MASSQGTQPSKINKTEATVVFTEAYRSLTQLLFFSDNIMADVASKQQTTALFLSTIVIRTRRHTELTKKTDKPDGKPVLCQRTFSSVFRAVFLHS
jgi:hypothetical protein